ncbi:helix-turn-helix domain-containing protein [Caballeronia cordobensis]|uniref:helix-turn-helix domain-containing protein n=1 Tax=Caballeronia cordobensis TaxID=1353886 RepID=UPI00045EDEE5|nr:GP66 protein [Burkholderia sp. RPE67]
MRGELFRDVNVALATSYRMASLPAVDAGATRRALVTVACLSPTRSRMHADWVKRLIGEPSRVVDFSGLSRLETLAQCALVRQAVLDRLSSAQACAVVARFSQTPGEKQKGVSGLVAHFSATRSASARAALAADPLADPLWDLLWRRYLPARYGDGLSLREIARRTHTSKSTLSRRALELDRNLNELEQRALEILEQRFVSDGLCGALFARFVDAPEKCGGF